MKILYICTVPGFQVANDVQCFKEMGHEIYVINTFKDSWPFLQTMENFKTVKNLYQYDSFSYKLFPYSKIYLSKKFKVKKILLELLKNEEIDLVYISWDTGVLFETRIIHKIVKENNLNIPIVFRFLMYPASLNNFSIKIENFLCKSIIENIDGRIWPTDTMLEYCKAKFDLSKHGIDLVFPFLPSYRYFSNKKCSKLSEFDWEPHLIFTGSSNFTSPERNIAHIIKEITESKIHLHMAKIIPDDLSEKLINNNKYLHYFEPITMEKLPDFMKSFDGCLMVYNFVDTKTDRLKNGLPNRFFWAVAASIPIFVFSPNNELVSLENFVRENEIGITVKNVSELKDILLNGKLMNKITDNTNKNSLNCIFEKHFNKVENFLERLKRA